jgi:hypothetical protein
MTAIAPVPATLDDITVEWLNDALPEDFRHGSRVTSFDYTVISEGVGFVGDVARVTLTYDGDPPRGASTIIAKVPTQNEGFRNLSNMFGFFQKEIGFYRDVAPSLELSIPRALHLAEDPAFGNYLLLLEDLHPMEPGDQLASCPLEVAELALKEIARLHAHWWDSPRLADFASWLPGAGDPYFQLLEAGFHGALPKFEEVFGHLVDPRIVQVANTVGAKFQAAIDAGMARGNLTFIHGDFRLDNMMFGDGEATPRLVILDWQLPFRANGLSDVVYFLGGNFTPELRREHEDHLLRVYHDALLENGLKDYSLEQCLDDYRAAGLILVGYLVMGANDIDVSTFNERGQTLINTMFNRYSTTIMDLESWRYLPE